MRCNGTMNELEATRIAAVAPSCAHFLGLAQLAILLLLTSP
jgi:hypothetical protein